MTQASETDNDLYEALGLVMSRLTPRELAQTRPVCRVWREAASGTEVRRASFMQHWRLGGLVGDPRNPSFLDTATLAHFVRRHQVTRTDSLTAIAVRHGCVVTAIKRLNNLMSDHSLHSRAAVFVPVSSPSEMVGAHAVFEYCRIACRELLLLVSEREADAAREAMQREGGAGEGGAAMSRSQEEALQSKLVALLGRSLHVDEATARFYLAEAGWCLRTAVALCEQDLLWESKAPGGRRRTALKASRKRG